MQSTVTIPTEDYLTLCRAAKMYAAAVDDDVLSQSVTIAELVDVADVHAAVKFPNEVLFPPRQG